MRVKGPSKRYIFNVVNLKKKRSLYSQGMKIKMFSANRYNNTGEGWYSAGENITYKEGKVRKETFGMRRLLNTLSFELTFDYEDDLVYIASSTPYTYSMLMNHLKAVGKKQASYKKKVFEMDTLCRSLGGLPVPVLTVTNFEEQWYLQKRIMRPEISSTKPLFKNKQV